MKVIPVMKTLTKKYVYKNRKKIFVMKFRGVFKVLADLVNFNFKVL